MAMSDQKWVVDENGGRFVDLTPDEVAQRATDEAAWEVQQDTPPKPHLNNDGLARFSGAAPIAVYETIRMASVTRVSKGRYRAYHEEPMPTDQYSVIPAVFDANPRTIRTTARTTTYAEVRVTDLAGVVQDPTEVTVQTQRVIS